MSFKGYWKESEGRTRRLGGSSRAQIRPSPGVMVWCCGFGMLKLLYWNVGRYYVLLLRGVRGCLWYAKLYWV
jgi:hypothetical protein